MATFDAGKFPLGVVCEGTNIWVANGVSNTMTNLRAVDGAVLETFTVGTLPLQVTFDGAKDLERSIRQASSRTHENAVTQTAILRPP